MPFSLAMPPIGIINSPFKEKFGIPRQPGIVKSAIFEIDFFDPFAQDEAFRGLEGFSHVWILFIFDRIKRTEWKATVRPPREGGNKRLGVFATRSPYRPNPIGISAVKNEGWKLSEGKKILLVSGGDFLHETPVVDIKPYIPYTDSIQDAVAGFAPDSPQANMEIFFSREAEEKCGLITWNGNGSFRNFLIEILSQDPRPAYHSTKSTKKNYALRVCGFNVLWEAENGCIRVKDIVKEG